MTLRLPTAKILREPAAVQNLLTDAADFFASDWLGGGDDCAARKMTSIAEEVQNVGQVPASMELDFIAHRTLFLCINYH